MENETLHRILEFFLVGLAMGIVEDVIAITLTTDASINLHTILIVASVALPFAAFSELVIDR